MQLGSLEVIDSFRVAMFPSQEALSLHSETPFLEIIGDADRKRRPGKEQARERASQGKSKARERARPGKEQG